MANIREGKNTLKRKSDFFLAAVQFYCAVIWYSKSNKLGVMKKCIGSVVKSNGEKNANKIFSPIPWFS